jgi:hypothetical protein
MGLGWLVASVGMFFLALVDMPSIAFLSLMTLAYSFGFWFGKALLPFFLINMCRLCRALCVN